MSDDPIDISPEAIAKSAIALRTRWIFDVNFENTLIALAADRDRWKSLRDNAERQCAVLAAERDAKIAELAEMKIKHDLAAIEIDPAIASSVQVIRGTRFTVSQLLAEIAENVSPAKVAENFGLDAKSVTAVILELSRQFGRKVIGSIDDDLINEVENRLDAACFDNGKGFTQEAKDMIELIRSWPEH